MTDQGPLGPEKHSPETLGPEGLGTGRPAERRILPDKQLLAEAVANALIAEVSVARARHGSATVVLTGGSMGEAVMAALADRARSAESTALAPDWSGVDVWWGDERFLAAGDPDRNDTQAEQAGLDALGLDPERVHRCPTPNQTGGDVARAADAYAQRLQQAAVAAGDAGATLPRLDVVMLGVGPDGHVASLFPGHPALAETSRTVVGVTDSPKPPPVRVTLTLAALRQAAQVWFLVSGPDKADAVRAAGTAREADRSGSADTPADLPAGLVTGRRATVWWLDRAAAGLDS